MTSAKYFELRMRSGKKGPGKTVAIFATEADAESAKLVAKASNPASDVFVSELTLDVVTADEYKIDAEKRAEAEAKRQAALAALSDEQKAALGLV